MRNWMCVPYDLNLRNLNEFVLTLLFHHLITFFNIWLIQALYFLTSTYYILFFFSLIILFPN